MCLSRNARFKEFEKSKKSAIIRRNFVPEATPPEGGATPTTTGETKKGKGSMTRDNAPSEYHAAQGSIHLSMVTTKIRLPSTLWPLTSVRLQSTNSR
ncbi:hypothetical protein AB6A40_011018 [Gnathostoma spinigerum]|uniref:Uncharacterized protein n=1 Tax=Gnathostoma spinigerum TaxID=75299 RepID=A0ABD6F0Z7_9BILA